MKKSSSVLAVLGSKIVQTLIFWTIFAMYTSRSIRVTARRVAQKSLWESHRRKISVSQNHHQGYWWPGMQKEAQEYVKKCDQCHRFAPNIHQLGGVLNPLSNPSLFA